MDVKKCNSCLKVKCVSFFGIESRAKNGYKPRCKECTNLYHRGFYNKNKQYYSDKMKKYYKDNKEIVKERVIKYYSKNSEKKSLYNKEYRIRNYDLLNKKSLEYIKNKTLNDPDFRLIRLHRKLIYRLNIEKNGRAKDILGYSKDELLSNLGRYPNKNEHIDHKVPISWFIDKSEVKLINDLRNLQILTRYENIKKGSRYSHSIDYSYYLEIINKIKEEYKTKITWK